ncbi:MAG: 4-(cytidine 5'-diphospho)-2-C-methyl-D-erythritol kinase [Phycisphaerales bacterium]|nr:MAG: 4-(cytidine 5'-diphospho)-2-C-methyl-D-erythritol kinase [Phycisphaerales bacterium]
MTQAPQFESLETGLLVRAPAKLNLSLLIAGKRPDGFHELETVMAKVDWFDEILIQPGDRRGIELCCEGPHWAPAGQDNLVYCAAEAVFAACGRACDVRLTLTKHIPAGSGLGGASSDAAATLIGLNAFFDLKLPRTRLEEIAAGLGSDVAFFLGGPLAFCTGRGEKTAELPGNFDFTAVLILPDINVSTSMVYANYTHDPRQYQLWSQRANAHLAKNRIDLVAKMCANMLEASCYHVCKELGELKEVVEALGVGPVCLSGSGSTLFFVVDDTDAERLGLLQDLIASKTGCRSIVVRNNRW